jgi:hypothetical protein
MKLAKPAQENGPDRQNRDLSKNSIIENEERKSQISYQIRTRPRLTVGKYPRFRGSGPPIITCSVLGASGTENGESCGASGIETWGSRDRDAELAVLRVLMGSLDPIKEFVG